MDDVWPEKVFLHRKKGKQAGQKAWPSHLQMPGLLLLARHEKG